MKIVLITDPRADTAEPVSQTQRALLRLAAQTIVRRLPLPAVSVLAPQAPRDGTPGRTVADTLDHEGITAEPVSSDSLRLLDGFVPENAAFEANIGVLNADVAGRVPVLVAQVPVLEAYLADVLVQPYHFPAGVHHPALYVLDSEDKTVTALTF